MITFDVEADGQPNDVSSSISAGVREFVRRDDAMHNQASAFLSPIENAIRLTATTMQNGDRRRDVHCRCQGRVSEEVTTIVIDVTVDPPLPEEEDVTKSREGTAPVPEGSEVAG